MVIYAVGNYEKSIETLVCPVIRIDGTEDWRMNATNIAERFYDKNGFIKKTMSRGEYFETLNDLKYQLADYVNWFNNHRIHSSLGYLTPYQYKVNTLKKVV